VKKQARIMGKWQIMEIYVPGCAGDEDFSYPSHRKEMSTGVVNRIPQFNSNLSFALPISPWTYFLTWDNIKQASLSVSY